MWYFYTCFQWNSIDELNKLKSLAQLNAKGNPVFQSDLQENTRQLTIAKIAHLKVFNRSQVVLSKIACTRER